ncbi:MAG: DNA-binding response regulator [Dehalococcoidia bacterium]|nr:DNA-binding response regulator [Dehalococcoidia bacterium]MQG09672.1 response regulator transcription factor [SAR202 cluster bacterium]|tara:strand:- start:1732 stop:2460 length:729 start_codon:yes stop_codon:yes gene_type:complete
MNDNKKNFNENQFNLLLVEDDRTLREAIRYNLISQGYNVYSTEDGAEGLNIAKSKPVDLILLDLMLPKLSGLEICKTLRRDGSILPIIMLTAKDSEFDKVYGIESGADDYITKPFSMRELMARISSQLRRMKMNVDVKNSKSEEIIKLADRVIIDKLKREVIVDGNNIDLRAREFDLFAYLSSSPGRVFTREQLLKDVWGFDYIGDTRTVDVHIRWLRSKIENSSQKAIIGTVRAVGYRVIV